MDPNDSQAPKPHSRDPQSRHPRASDPQSKDPLTPGPSIPGSPELGTPGLDSPSSRETVQGITPTESTWPELGDQIGPWVLERNYNLEGSGEMFVARRADGTFEREVLITFLRPDTSNPQAKVEFDREVELQAKLDHPGIAKVYGAGKTNSGVRYMVTEFLHGDDIEVHLNAGRGPLPERIRLFALVCEAVQHAHDQGISGMHMQASNVHYIPDGTIRLVVYGLAHSNGPEPIDPLRTWPEYAVEYASPEEWAGRQANHLSDVYSLGALLHLLLADCLPRDLSGLTPAEASSLVNKEWLQWASTRVLANDSVDSASKRGTTVKQMAHELSGDLDRILAKALARTPEQRYESPRALANDLQRHLEGQPIRARGPAPFYAMRRVIARNRVPILVSALVIGVLGWALWRSVRYATLAEDAFLVARTAETDANKQSTRLRQLCVRYLTELGPAMQGRPGLEDARRHLLRVGAPLLDHLRESGHEDRDLRIHIAQSYLALADADWISRDQSNSGRIPDSVQKAIELTYSLMTSADPSASHSSGGYWARTQRCAAWYSTLALDAKFQENQREDSDQTLKELGIERAKVPPIMLQLLMSCDLITRSSLLQFDQALVEWDLDVLRRFAREPSEMRPYFAGDLPGNETRRSILLVRAGRERDALFELPPLVHQLREEALRHTPPIMDLITLECEAWLYLALARARVGLEPGEALASALRVMAVVQERYSQEPGIPEDLGHFRLVLGECLYLMGPAEYGPALETLEAAAETWRYLCQQGATWPLYRVRLAESLCLKARVLLARGNALIALEQLAEAKTILEDLPDPSARHPLTLWMQARVNILRNECLPPQDRKGLSAIASDLSSLEAIRVNKNLVADLQSRLATMRAQSKETARGAGGGD